MSDMTSRPPDFDIAPSSATAAARTMAGSPNEAARARPATTALQAVRAGVGRAGRNVMLVLLVWLVFLALAWVAALPAWRWFDRVLSLAPEGDRLLGGLNIALLRELTHYDRTPTAAVAFGSVWTFFVFALILNPFMAGGTLGVLASPETASPAAAPRGVTQRFVGEGMRYYWRFVRILLLVALLGGGVTMILTTVFEAIGVAFDESGRARASMWAENLMLLTVLIVFGLSSLIVDTSRIMMIRRDDGRAVAAVRQALGFLWRNAGAVIVIGCAFVVLLAVAVVVYNLIAGSITPISWGLIAFTILWQQLFAIARTALRVGFLAAFAELVDAREPRPIEPPPATDITPADEPVYELPMLG